MQERFSISTCSIVMDRLRSVCSTSSSSCCSGSTCTDADRVAGVTNVNVQCELCAEAASLYCAADEARLCWGCDARIHSANFLVARHSRALLCACCGALMTSGPVLRPSRIHICKACSEVLYSDEESKVKCNSDESCSGDDDEESLSSLLPLNETRKRSPDDACRIEGVGDSEEEDYCHLLFPSSSVTFKRRKTLRPHHFVEY